MNNVKRFNLLRAGSLTVLFLCGVTLAQAARVGDITGKKGTSEMGGGYDKKSKWMFRPALNAGYNKLMSGYEGYDNLGNVGIDLYMRRTPLGGPPSWSDHLFFRLSLEYFPLQVPEGLNGITEDLYALNGSFLYEFDNVWRLRLPLPMFLGLGYGLYRDEIELKNSTSGKITATHSYKGYVFSAGTTIPEFKYFPFKLIPEIRYHRYRRVKDKAAHMTYQLGVVLWPREKK